MKLRTLYLLFASVFLTGCIHYNYAVQREGSPIPYENLYGHDDHKKYEFYSTLFHSGSEKRFTDNVEITHLTDLLNRSLGRSKLGGRWSQLRFDLTEESGVEVLIDTVVLQHFSSTGELLTPSRTESTLKKCDGVIGCRASMYLHYAKALPDQIVEKVSFTLRHQGEEKVIEYTIPLNYRFHYTFWDMLMGV